MPKPGCDCTMWNGWRHNARGTNNPMQLMTDALACTGSRHGMLVQPSSKDCALVRFDRFTRMPRFQLRAGAVIGGEEIVFPLCQEGTEFDFVDQRTSPCRMKFIGIHGKTALRIELTVTVPFRPRDKAFSSAPVFLIELRAHRLPGIFRWNLRDREQDVSELELFCELIPPAAWRVEEKGTGLELYFASIRAEVKQAFKDVWDTEDEAVPQHDRLWAVSGERQGLRFSQTVPIREQPGDGTLTLAWATWSEPVLRIHQDLHPFVYAERFSSLAAVCNWVDADGAAEIRGNARKVDARVSDHNLGPAVDHLMAYSLHSWMINTWWVEDSFSVWEGTCYFHSTVDVEFTQSPFYLCVWPELLASELDNWPAFSLPATDLLGEAGEGGLYLSHDTGAHAGIRHQIYSHDMAVEECANYVILACAYWKRTGDDSLLRKHAETIRRFLVFLTAADTTGTGVPDKGVANTIDDASPAVQFGTEQTYLSAKVLCAFVAGEHLFAYLQDDAMKTQCRERAAMARTRIEKRGWVEDHYGVLLEKSGKLTNPWTGEAMDCEEIPGWDAAHIYTCNAQAVLDLVGIDAGLRPDRVRQDLRVASERCAHAYGNTHSDYDNEQIEQHESMLGLAGVAANPGWVSMNMLRDIAAAYRGVDLLSFNQNYWEWQTTTNSREAKMFFETFGGNNLCFYPRGVAIWGLFDAVGGRVVDAVDGVDRRRPAFPQARVPDLWTADW